MWARFPLSIAATAISMAALASLTPSHLRCEYLTNPLGIDEAVPRLSWIVASPEKDQRQTAYRILVATSAENLKKGVGDLWDSGQVSSDDTVDVEYKGKPLAPGQRAWWTVEVKDRDGSPSKWADPAYWERGLDGTAWKASWIGRRDPERLGLDTGGAKWIWYPEGNPAVEAPAGDRHFRYRFAAATKPVRSRLAIAIDDSFVLWVNGHAVASGSGWRAYTEYDLTNDLRAGDNVIDIIGHNGGGRAGMLAVGSLQIGDTLVYFHTDKAWETSIDGQTWQPSMEIADL
ncbi:MAG TPA: hypothetical protein VG820_00855, partial [Fimbriimonadaceae bacterium]|nr:hypothetical protein [Fimbriimonadaceae bacterium]